MRIGFLGKLPPECQVQWEQMSLKLQLSLPGRLPMSAPGGHPWPGRTHNILLQLFLLPVIFAEEVEMRGRDEASTPGLARQLDELECPALKSLLPIAQRLLRFDRAAASQALDRL